VPIYGRVRYAGELHVRIRVLGVPVTLLPTLDKPEKETVRQPKKTKKSKPSKTKELGEELSRSVREDGVSATLAYLGKLAEIAAQALGRVLHSFTVDRLKLDMLIAAGDADDTAVRYGQVCGVLYPTLAALSGPIKVRRRELRVEPNFLLEKSDARFDVRLHVWVYRLVGAAIVLLVRMLLLKDTMVDDPIIDKEVTNHGK
jgi:hypothetical protein